MASHAADTLDIADDRSIAARRKRRLSSSLVEPIDTSINSSFLQAAHSANAHAQTAQTPSKPKKKVRFSDPGADTVTVSSSSGLTPYLRRASFAPRTHDARDSSPPRLRPQAPRRRLSLPSSTTTLPSPSLSSSPLSISGEMQYPPLRQILEARVKRRLRRRDLSQEMNDIDAEKKSKAQLMHEIEDLKYKLKLAHERNDKEEPYEGSNATKSQRIQQLEDQLAQLKQECAQTSTVHDFPEESFSRDEAGIFIDDTAEDFLEDHSGKTRALRDATLDKLPPSVKETATQASIPHPAQRDMLREARLSLEYLFPGEIALGLIPEDPKPLFDVMLERLRALKTQHLVAEDALSTTQTQESNLRTQFNAVLEQLDRARRYSEKLSQKHASEKTRADAAEARIPLMEISAKDASDKAEALQKEARDHERSLKKLQGSLESYRAEVSKLEDLINRQEEQHQAAMTALHSEMDEAVADLECHVAAETLGRREAEQEVVERDAKIKELQHRERELVATVNEKQSIIREMETTLEAVNTNRDHEVGQLNVQISTLSCDFDDAIAQRDHAQRARDILMRKLEDEKNAGLRAIDALRSELAHFSRNTDGIKAAYASDSQRRGAEVSQHKGLLTPSTETRFYDAEIPGHVETRRGKGKRKQRPDSGIGILEEEAEEDSEMVDMIAF